MSVRRAFAARTVPGSRPCSVSGGAAAGAGTGARRRARGRAARCASSAPIRPEVQELLDQAVTAHTLPGIVAEAVEGERRRLGTAGVSDTGTRAPRRADEGFRVGSTTKTFTAVVVLQLAAEHQLDLDDTVERWLPGLVHGNGHDGRSVTIRQLLSMTSGIFNYSLDERMLAGHHGPAFQERRFERFAPEQLVEVAMGPTSRVRRPRSAAPTPGTTPGTAIPPPAPRSTT